MSISIVPLSNVERYDSCALSDSNPDESPQVYDGRKQRGGLVLSIFLVLLTANLITFYYRWTIGIELTIVMLAIICVFWLGQVIDTVRVTTDTNWAISRMPENGGGA